MAIREDKDASAEEREIAFCNAGLMALDGKSALRILDAIDDRNAKREYYLSDAVRVVRDLGLEAVALEAERKAARDARYAARKARR